MDRSSASGVSDDPTVLPGRGEGRIAVKLSLVELERSCNVSRRKYNKS